MVGPIPSHDLAMVISCGLLRRHCAGNIEMTAERSGIYVETEIESEIIMLIGDSKGVRMNLSHFNENLKLLANSTSGGRWGGGTSTSCSADPAVICSRRPPP